jgi:hypothetical protein
MLFFTTYVQDVMEVNSANTLVFLLAHVSYVQIFSTADTLVRSEV